MRRASALVLVAILAGCAEQPSSGPSAGGAPLVAFVDAPEDHGINRTILVLREGGEAERLTYFADGSWLPRLAPGVDYDAATLDALFARAGGTERGGLVFRVERGSVPPGATAALGAFLAGDWPTPFVPEGAPHPWYRPIVLVRAEPHAATEGPPEGLEDYTGEHARLGELVRAFGAAREAFVPAEVDETSVPFDPPALDCLRATTSVATPVASVGEPVEVRAEITNCGGTDLALDPRDCDARPYPTVQIGGAITLPLMAVMPATDAPSAAYAIDLVCRGDEPPLALAPGQTRALVRRWNGTFATCRTADACEFRAATPADYSFVAFTPSQREATPAGVTIVDREGARVPLLLVTQHEWVNTTGDGHVIADYGPHCAPVRYSESPPSLTIYYYGDRPALEGAIVQDWRGEPWGGGPVVTVSADRLALTRLENGTATLTSPYNDTVELARIERDGADFVVNGTRLAPGGTHVERHAHTLHEREGTFETVSILEYKHLGEAPVVWTRAGGCA